MLIGTVMGRLPPAHRGTAAGIITAGGSFGQFVFAPIAQTLISTCGVDDRDVVSERLLARRAALIRPISGRSLNGDAERPSPADGGLARRCKNAFADRSYPTPARELSHLWFSHRVSR